MLTPAFDISQNEEFIIITIKAPFAKVSEVETFIEGKEFKFYSKPYYLRLSLPGNLIEDGRENAKYDVESGVFTIQVPKGTAGEVFVGLDMITKLLTPKGQVSAKAPLIEVIGSEKDEVSIEAKKEDEEEEFDWLIEQTPYEDPVASLDGPKYGFANQRSGVFSRLKSELGLIVDLEEPDSTPASQRGQLRMITEDEKFDDDHYLADLYDDNVIQEILRYEPPWLEDEALAPFTVEEKEKLRNLPRKEYLLEDKTVTGVCFSLVDILFSYCYTLRSTEGEHTVESAWTICKLSTSLSWLQIGASLKEVLVSSFRRCLSYPLYRHWGLTQTVFKDLQKLFTMGRGYLLKCLLQIHGLLQESDPYYILNDLYITDYCVWIQSVSEKRLNSIAQALSKIKIQKNDVGFHIEELEEAAEDCIRDSEIETVSENIAKISLEKSTNENCCHKETLTVPVRDSDDDSTDTDDVSTIGNDETTESDDEASSSDYTSNLVNSRNSLRCIKEIHTQAHV